MGVSDHPTDSSFSRRPTRVFLLCDSKFVYWGSNRKKNEVNRTTLREVMRFWIQIISKISAKIDTFPIFEEKSHSMDNTKILHPFVAYRLRFFLLCDSTCLYWGSYIQKNYVNRTTLREIMRFLSQNLSKISLNKKILQKKNPTYLLGFVGRCDRKHTYIFVWP